MDPLQLTESQRAIVDRFGVRFRESKEWAPKQRDFDNLRDTIQSWYILPADQTALAVGNSFQVQVGPRTLVKSWKSLAAVVKAVGGFAKFLKLCTVTYKAVSESPLGITATQAHQSEAQTGTRRLTATAIISVPCERVVNELPKAA